ncbi:MAG TPA: PQQ-dependent sugar dehydrogenase [Polyangiaceae bacterium]|nr:PQQ-dependent sugar dehydrogenase [Polyangiaceae bacterium]
MRARALTRPLGLLTLLFCLHCSRGAKAKLSAPFDQTLVEDQAWVTDASNATDVAFHADGRAVITRKSGEITIRHADGSLVEITGKFPKLDTSSEKGLLGVVADPGVATNDTFYFYASDGPSDDRHRVYKGVLHDDDTLTIDLDNPIVGAARGVGPGLEGPANHDGGGLFIYKNQLYVGVGDTGANAEPPTNKYSSCLNKGNGKILRVNLDGSVPNDNPLASEDMVTACDSTGADWETAAPDRRVFAWGLRNPWRFFIDPKTSLLWIGDVGETQREEISVGSSGMHFGYPFIEGNLDQSMANGDLRLDMMCDEGFVPPRPCTAPVYDYGHDEGQSVTGGVIPSGCGWSNAFGGKTYYLFADYGQNWMRALEVSPDHKGVVSAKPADFGKLSGGLASIRQGPDGAVYVVHYGSGTLTRIAPLALTGADCSGSGTGGTNAAAGNDDSSSGCGCRTARDEPAGTIAAALGFGALALGAFRVGRRRSRGAGRRGGEV